MVSVQYVQRWKHTEQMQRKIRLVCSSIQLHHLNSRLWISKKISITRADRNRNAVWLSLPSVLTNWEVEQLPGASSLIATGGEIVWANIMSCSCPSNIFFKYIFQQHTDVRKCPFSASRKLQLLAPAHIPHFHHTWTNSYTKSICQTVLYFVNPLFKAI